MRDQEEIADQPDSVDAEGRQHLVADVVLDGPAGDDGDPGAGLESLADRLVPGDLQDHAKAPRIHGVVGQGLLHDLSGSRATLAHDEGLVGEFGQAHRAPGGPGVHGRHGQDQLVLREGLVMDPPLFEARAHHRHLVCSLDHAPHDVPGPADVQGNRHLRMLALEGRQQRREDVGARDVASPEGQVPLEASLVLVDGLLGFLAQGQDAPGVPVQDLAGPGGRHRLTRPVEEAQPKFRLKRLDVSAHRRLGEEDCLGRPGKTPELHDLAEDLQGPQVHGTYTPFLTVRDW